MRLPFTQEQFFQAFAAYNSAVWPLQVVFNLAAVVMVILVLATPGRAGRPVSLGLGILWTWLALGYHLAFFWAINPAAPVFAAISLIASLVFLWLGTWRASIQFKKGFDGRKLLGLAAIFYALLLYPLIGYYSGHRLPAAPTFGLPCPTTIFTFGILFLAARPLPRSVLIAPAVWAAIGFLAAFSLGVPQDYALAAAAASGIWLAIFNR